MTPLSRTLAICALAVSVASGVSAAHAEEAALPNLVIHSLRLDRLSADQVTLDFVVSNTGKAPMTDLFAISIYVDGTIVRHTFYRQLKPGKTVEKDPDPVKPIGPRQSHRFSVGGFQEFSSGRHRIKVVVDRLDVRDPVAEAALGRYANNRVRETREDDNDAMLMVRK